MLKGIINKPLL